VGDADFEKAREADVRELLPVQAYSQKQLSSVSVRVEELTRFVTSPIRRQLAEIDQRIEEAAGKVRENYATLQRQRQLQMTIRRLELAEKSLGEQAVNLRASIDDVSDADRLVLEEKPKYDSARFLANGWHSSLTRAMEATERLLATVVELDDGITSTGEQPPALLEPLDALRSNTDQLLGALRDSITAALANLSNEVVSGSEHDRRYQLVHQLMADFEEAYGTVKERSTAHSAKLAELAEVETQQRAAGQSLRNQRAECQELGTPEVEHTQLLHDMFVLMGDRSDRLAEQCTALSELSGGLLKATLQRGQGLALVAERFRGVVAGSNLRSNKVEALFEQLSADSRPMATWEAAVTELELLSSNGEDFEINSESYPVLGRLGLSVADLKRVASRLTADGWLALALTPVADHPRFEYQTKEDEFIDFALASAGQQATALLRVLLAQSGPPLIIDQPEDDLDSEVVQDVVES